MSIGVYSPLSPKTWICVTALLMQITCICKHFYTAGLHWKHLTSEIWVFFYVKQPKEMQYTCHEVKQVSSKTVKMTTVICCIFLQLISLKCCIYDSVKYAAFPQILK